MKRSSRTKLETCCFVGPFNSFFHR